jgi:hypothetical protein
LIGRTGRCTRHTGDDKAWRCAREGSGGGLDWGLLKISVHSACTPDVRHNVGSQSTGGRGRKEGNKIGGLLGKDQEWLGMAVARWLGQGLRLMPQGMPMSALGT